MSYELLGFKMVYGLWFMVQGVEVSIPFQKVPSLHINGNGIVFTEY